MATALQAQKEKLKYVLFDQEQLGGALASYPRQKLVMTAPVDLPGYGKVKLRRTTKEAILDLWKDIAAKTALNIEAPVKVESVKPGADGAFVVETSAGTRRARRVALCIGRRGTPRKLGVPGEGASKVTYRLTEPEQYRGTKCMVVGGGDSAVEAALMLSRQPGTQVILAHRGKAFDRCKPDNFVALEEARVRGAVAVRLGAAPTESGEGYVMVRAAAGAGEAGAERVENEWVIVCIGGELPTAWLSKIGIEVQTLRGQVHPAMRA